MCFYQKSKKSQKKSKKVQVKGKKLSYKILKKAG